MVVLLTRHLKSTGGDRRRIKGVWISLLFPLFSADTPDVKRFAQVFLSQCSHWRASAYVGGPNLLTWYGIYQLSNLVRCSAGLCSVIRDKPYSNLLPSREYELSNILANPFLYCS